MGQERAKRRKNANAGDAKWKLVERLVKVIEAHNLPDCVVTADVMVPVKFEGEGPRQVDVLVTWSVEGGTRKRAVEVKDHSARCDVQVIDAHDSKWRDLDVDEYGIAAVGGFTRGAQKKAARKGIVLYTLPRVKPEATVLQDWTWEIPETRFRFLGWRFDFEAVESKQAYERAAVRDGLDLRIETRDGTAFILRDQVAERATERMAMGHRLSGVEALTVSTATEGWERVTYGGEPLPVPTLVTVNVEFVTTILPHERSVYAHPSGTMGEVVKWDGANGPQALLAASARVPGRPGAFSSRWENVPAPTRTGAKKKGNR